MISLQDLYGDEYDTSGVIESLAPVDDLDPELGQLTLRGSFSAPILKGGIRASGTTKGVAKAGANIPGIQLSKSQIAALKKRQAQAKKNKKRQQELAKKRARAAAKKKKVAKPKAAKPQFWTPETLAAARGGKPIRVTATKEFAKRAGATRTKAPTMRDPKRQAKAQAAVDRQRAFERKLLSRGVVGPKLPDVATIKACAPGAYRMMACCGPLGGAAASKLLDKIVDELELAATQREATYEHNVITNTDAYRRKVLDYLRQLNLRH